MYVERWEKLIIYERYKHRKPTSRIKNICIYVQHFRFTRTIDPDNRKHPKVSVQRVMQIREGASSRIFVVPLTLTVSMSSFPLGPRGSDESSDASKTDGGFYRRSPKEERFNPGPRTLERVDKTLLTLCSSLEL